MRAVENNEVIVAMSGGVDSSVAAALLVRQGFAVRGLFMRYWGDVDDLIPGGEDFTNCCNIEAMHDAQMVCKHLGIPFEAMDLRAEFRQHVVKPFLRAYEEGRTPNPCINCNHAIKFAMIERVLKVNSNQSSVNSTLYFATGHYLRTTNYQLLPERSRRATEFQGNPSTLLGFAQGINSKDPVRVFTACDERKDQSYFLYTLTQEKLRRLLFPLGEYTKSQARELAREFGLPVAEKKESQEICFVKGKVGEFLESRVKAEAGAFVSVGGERLGTHRGLPFYTIGQRQGLELNGGPWYVAEKRAATNEVVVASPRETQWHLKREAVVRNVNWIAGSPPEFPARVIAKPRAHHPGASASIEMLNVNGQMSNVRIAFDDPERALTPGQSMVFYRDTPEGLELLGGGVIE